MKTSLVIITYNWPQALALVLASIARQSRLPDEVIVTDDGSREDTGELVQRCARDFPCPIAHVWQPDAGFRAARARNRGIAAARADYVILIDGDMLLHPHFVADHNALALPAHSLQGSRLNASKSETTRLLNGGRARFSPLMPGPFPRHRAVRWPWLAQLKARSSSGGRIYSCNMSAWRDDLLRVNGFDERFEGYGGEDQEISKRLHHAGVRRRQLKFAGLAIHLHHNSRAPSDPNDMNLPNNVMLAHTARTRAIRCELGIDAHADLLTTAPADLRRVHG